MTLRTRLARLEARRRPASAIGLAVNVLIQHADGALYGTFADGQRRQLTPDELASLNATDVHIIIVEYTDAA